jgi:hypothetical protein
VVNLSIYIAGPNLYPLAWNEQLLRLMFTLRYWALSLTAHVSSACSALVKALVGDFYFIINNKIIKFLYPPSEPRSNIQYIYCKIIKNN